MIVDEYIEGRKVGVIYEQIIKEGVPNVVEKNDDDFALLCVGDTGTGKSMLMLHTYEMFDPDGCNVDAIGFDAAGFAKALKLASKKQGRRFVCNDEANISKRKAMTTYNNDLLDTYFAIRGLNIFHWWNNPSMDIIDKPFIDRLKGIILIVAPSKSKNAPRVIYYFMPKDLMKMFEKFANLSLKTLTKHAKKYSYLQSWFKDYDGKLREPYTKKKGGRMVEKVDDFFEKYGDDENSFQTRDILKILGGVTSMTLWNYTKALKDEGSFEEGVDYIKKSPKLRIFTKAAVEKLIEHQKKVQARTGAVL